MYGDIGRSGAKKAPCRPFRPYDAFVGALPKIFRAYLNFTKRYGMMDKDLRRKVLLSSCRKYR